MNYRQAKKRRKFNYIVSTLKRDYHLSHVGWSDIRWIIRQFKEDRRRESKELDYSFLKESVSDNDT